MNDVAGSSLCILEVCSPQLSILPVLFVCTCQTVIVFLFSAECISLDNSGLFFLKPYLTNASIRSVVASTPSSCQHFNTLHYSLLYQRALYPPDHFYSVQKVLDVGGHPVRFDRKFEGFIQIHINPVAFRSAVD